MRPKRFSAPIGAERRLATALRKIARITAGIIDPHIDGATLRNESAMASALAHYAAQLQPYASTLVQRVLSDISRHNLKSWEQTSLIIGRELSTTLAESSIGRTARDLHESQVSLITSIPPEAGARAQRLAQEAATGGRRADETARMLMETEQVTKSRATLIARTETAKANTALTTARALYVGADRYWWRTMEDADVRESHAEMGERSDNGESFDFNNDPEVGDEGPHAPGAFPNCRCYPEPIIGKGTAEEME